jgi:hypothetical protein
MRYMEDRLRQEADEEKAALATLNKYRQQWDATWALADEDEGRRQREQLKATIKSELPCEWVMGHHYTVRKLGDTLAGYAPPA